MEAGSHMKSPCISQCLYNFEENHCVGCFRTLTEIESWWKLSEEEKRKVLKQIKERRRRIGGGSLRGCIGNTEKR